MRHINTRQVDNHCWLIEVTDGYTTEWTAQLDGAKLAIWYGNNRHTRPQGEAAMSSHKESACLGEAMELVYNWAQMGSQCNELLDLRWAVHEGTRVGAQRA